MNSTPLTIELIQQIDIAYMWICQQRRQYTLDADIWHLRFHWHRERQHLIQSLRDGNYCFSPMQTIEKATGESLVLWGARDALVLKEGNNFSFFYHAQSTYQCRGQKLQDTLRIFCPNLIKINIANPTLSCNET